MTKQNSTLSIDRKFALTFEEAAEYFNVGETNLRKICKEDPRANGFTCKVGAKTLILRAKFEAYMCEHHVLSA